MARNGLFRWFTASLVIAAAMGAGGGAAASESATAKRFVSINLCADALLMALADPDQIAALSPVAVDPTLSFLADEAKAYRHDAGSAERVVAIDPDVVLAGRFTRRATRDMLARLGYEVILINPARSVEDSIAQIRLVAGLLDREVRGEALVAEIDRARADAAATDGAAPSAAIYQRRGYVTGGGTLSEDLMRIVGLANHGGELSGEIGGFVPLERLIARPPDVLVVSERDAAPEDQGSALLAHPALQRLFPPERRIVLPQRLTVCGGPSLPAAIDWLKAQIAQITDATGR